MANSNRITIVINADGTAFIEGIEQVNSSQKKLESDTKSITSQIKAHWLSVVAAVYAVKKAWDFADEAAKADQLKQSFINLAASHGVNADQLIANLKRVSAETVATGALMRSAGYAMVLGIPADKLVQMMEIARAASKITGQTVQKSFEDIGLGVARQSRLILDNLGIIIKEEKAYEDFARSINKTASQLTDAEKKQAFLNAAMKAGEDIVKRVGEQELSAADAMAIFMAKLQDLKVFIGQVLITTVSWFTTIPLGISELFAMSLSSISGYLARLVELGSRLPWVGDRFKGLSETLQGFSDFENSAAEEARRMAATAYKVGSAIWEEKKAVVGLTQALNGNKEAVIATVEQKNKLLEAERQLAETAKRATLEALKDEAKLELDTLDREYELKAIKAEEYYGRKREIENRAFEESKARIMEAIDAENRMAEAKLKALTGQPVEVIQAAEIEHATKLIELGQEYRQMKGEQEQEELKNIYGLMNAYNELAAQQFAARMELAVLAQESPYQDTLKNYQGDNELVKDQIKYQGKLALLQDYNTKVIQKMIDAGATEDQIKARYSELATQYALKEKQARIAYAGEAFAASANFMQNIMVATGSHSKTMFKMMQALSIAHAVMSGIEAAQDAWKWGMKIAGPPGAVAFTAISVAATAARIRQIADTKIGGATASISEGGTANPSYSGGSTGAYPPVQPVQDVNQKPSLQINLHVYGNVVDHDVFARELVPSITKAINDGVR